MATPPFVGCARQVAVDGAGPPAISEPTQLGTSAAVIGANGGYCPFRAMVAKST